MTALPPEMFPQDDSPLPAWPGYVLAGLAIVLAVISLILQLN